MTEELTDIYHGYGHSNGQRHVAFRYTEVPIRGTVIDPAKVRLLDGTQPVEGTLMICCTCRQTIWIGDLTW